MTEKGAARLIKTMQIYYPNFKPQDEVKSAVAWAAAFRQEDFTEVEKALMAYVRNDRSGFAPSPGQLMQYINLIDKPVYDSPYDAWAKVRKAISNSTWHSEEEFAKLPADIQEVIGSPSVLKTMASSESFNESVEESNFIKRYEVVKGRQQTVNNMPTEIRARLETYQAPTPQIEALPVFTAPEEIVTDADKDYVSRLKGLLNASE